MRANQYTLDAGEVQQLTEQVLNEHLELTDQGPKCRAEVLLSVLLYAACRVGSIFAACQRLRGAPTDEAVRQALVAQLPEMDELERRLQASLTELLPAKLKRRKWPLAIDITLIPYHGQPFADKSEVYRGEAKSGTTHFHAYATCYLTRHGQRYTVALMPVTLGTSMKVVVQTLLARAREAGIRPKFLLLDRGFYAVDLIRYLQSARIPFIMPAPLGYIKYFA